MNGLILDGSKNVFKVECEDGQLRSCSIKGKILRAGKGYYNPLAPGDIVFLDEDSIEGEKGMIAGLSERKNEFVRWNVKKRQPQVLAANLDCLLIVTTPDEPAFKPQFIDRALAQAECQNITPVVVCNKYDLPAAQDSAFQDRLADWERIGYKVIRSSARTGEGIEELALFMENKLCAFVGKSGVGKSSIINVLDNSVVLKTGSLSKKYGKGTHTTTKGTLIHLQLNESLVGGRKDAVADIIDTPGVKTFLLNGISAENLALYYREFFPFLGKCSFGMSCSHLHEKGCAVCRAVEEGAISAARYESWKHTFEELESGTWGD
ncbi:MAG: ribosome small subunit-dependent GTPase A [Treponema sp.]|nr:ribosome small subunit-dependent GTPase A [Treponema sp.]